MRSINIHHKSRKSGTKRERPRRNKKERVKTIARDNTRKKGRQKKKEREKTRTNQTK